MRREIVREPVVTGFYISINDLLKDFPRTHVQRADTRYIFHSYKLSSIAGSVNAAECMTISLPLKAMDKPPAS